MVKIVDCPLCNGGQLKIEVPSGCQVIVDGRPSKLPLKKMCKTCNRNIKYLVCDDDKYEQTLRMVRE